MAKKKTEVKETKVEVRLQPLNLATIKVPIVGTTDLWMDKFPEAVMQRILDKQTGQAKGAKKKLRVIQDEIKQAIHKTSTGKIGFPASAFKAGMISCCSFVGDKFFSKKLISGSVRIINAEDGLIPIKFKKQITVKHNIGHNMKFTPAFQDWSCELILRYDANNVSGSDLVTLLDHAGSYVGIGAFRPKCAGGGSGDQGCYEVKKSKVKA